MPKKKLTVALKKGMALSAWRVSLRAKKLVYALICDHPLKYPWGRSSVAYIGTTKKGIRRIAASAAYRADAILRLRGVRSFHVRIITCKSRSGVATWHKLERALLLTFREMYGDIPKCNNQGQKTKPRDEFEYFRRDRLRRLLQELE